MKYFIYSVIGIVAISVLAGFFIVGSPKEERLRRFDDRRVRDLQVLQNQILNYWQNKEELPENLALLQDNISGFVPPLDPETGEDYGYTVKGPLTFELCTNFNRVSLGGEKVPTLRPLPVEQSFFQLQNWEHKAGEVCFEREIDPELYKPFQKERRP